MQTSLIVFLILITFQLISCQPPKLLAKYYLEYGKVRFFIERDATSEKGVTKIIADADSNGIRNYYTFYADRILKINERENLAFRAIGENEIEYKQIRKVSQFDRLILSNASKILDSLKLSWMDPDSIIAFDSQVLYYHGRPKSIKLKPL